MPERSGLAERVRPAVGEESLAKGRKALLASVMLIGLRDIDCPDCEVLSVMLFYGSLRFMLALRAGCSPPRLRARGEAGAFLEGQSRR